MDDWEVQGVFDVYGVRAEGDEKERHFLGRRETLGDAKALIETATALSGSLFDYAYAKQFGVGTVAIRKRPPDLVRNPWPTSAPA